MEAKEAPGKKWDLGKPRWDLLPWDAIYGVVNVLTYGAEKYEDRNWEKGMQFSRLFAATMRHLTAWWNGPMTGHPVARDQESGLLHLDHAITDLLFLRTFIERGMEEWDDRPRPREETP
jgi:hypothetical protein